MPDEPERPAELEVIARSRLTVPGGRPREIVIVGAPGRRPGGQERTPDVEG
jgi:hypothetical protein